MYLDDVHANEMHTDVHIPGTGDSDDDSKARGKKVTDSEENVPQSPVDEHLNAASPEEIPQPYSDETFRRIAVQWLLETNQVLIFLRIK
jgi:hypothetical protein